MRNRYSICARTGAILACLITAAAAGQPQSAPSEGLIAELRVPPGLIRPGDPVPVTFLLRNRTSEPIRIPVPRVEASEGVRLPPELIFGGPDGGPALKLFFETQPPDIIRSSDAPRADRQGELVIGPRAVVGTEIDLRDHTKYLRYSGVYRLEWRPPIDGVARAEIEFRVEARKRAVLVTDFGKITFELAYETAPANVDNFLELVRSRFYDGKTFHRIQQGFVIQGGSPDGSGAGVRPDGKTVADELANVPFSTGTLAMSLRHDPETKDVIHDSASCQFFIGLTRLPELDGKYTVVGQATDEESMRTLNLLGSQAVDKDGRPRQPVWISSITLLDVEGPTPKRFDGAAAKP